jgi:FkbM family methyltransferase
MTDAALREVCVDGLRFQLDPTRYIDRSLIDGTGFEVGAVGALRRRMRQGMVAVDVGANFGYYTLLFSKWVGPTGRVVAFEPTTGYGERLRTHVALNNLTNVTIVPMGLGDTAADAEIAIGVCSATLHWVSSAPPAARECVRLVPFDVWWRAQKPVHGSARVDVMKIDVDGHEPAVLRGAEQTILADRPLLLLEIARPNYEQAGERVDDVVTWLQERGYDLLDGDRDAAFASTQALQETIHRMDVSCNLLCLPRTTFVR